MVKPAHIIEIVSNDIRNAQLYVAKQGAGLVQVAHPSAHRLQRNTSP